MRNYLKILFCIACVYITGCKKKIDANDSLPKIDFIFNGKHAQYSGIATGIDYEGVALIPVQITVNDSLFQYQLVAGTNLQNYIILIFNGPHPIEKENISEIKFAGLTYATNGNYYTFQQADCEAHIAIDENNRLSGSFSGALTVQGNETSKIDGTFENVVIK